MLCFQNNKWVFNVPQLGKPFFVEFNPYKKNELNKNLLIAKAVGLDKVKKINAPLKICDLSAGFGQDAYVLYQLGCRVTCVERCEIIARLLKDGLDRAQIDISLIVGESLDYLKNLQYKDYPDVIYFDPMFAVRKKSALVQKSARILQALAGEDNDAKEVFQYALTIAQKRVVVKRALHASGITEKKPDVVYKGKTIRFDVYLIE